MKNDLYIYVFDDCNNAMALLASHGKSLGFWVWICDCKMLIFCFFSTCEEL